jgi:glycosyltransferase involved in cell wall biosynthesis
VDCIPSWQRYGTAVVVDVDDLLSAVDPGNPAFAAYHPSNAAENWHHLERACRMADMVTVSTPALAERYGRHGRVRVLRNCVPEWYLRVGCGEDGTSAGLTSTAGSERPEPRPAPVVGWAGRVDVHAADLAVVGTAVAQALRQTSATFRAVGDEATLTALGVEGEVVPFMPFEDYPVQVARLDVGMAPLADTAFNRGKSFLKPLEMAALGVPFVASPLPEYVRLAGLGAGDLASRPRQWIAALRRLLNDAEYRAERAGRGREVAAGLTYEAHADGWATAWAEALRVRRETAA